jgi:hypothetical protein
MTADGKRLVELLNKVSYGISVYAYEQGSNKVISIVGDAVNIISLEKAQNILRAKTIEMLGIIQEIFELTTDEKAACSDSKEQ